MKALRTWVVSYPLILPCAFLATWLAGRLSLGHWPRPSLDDPKYIGVWVDVPYTITAALLVIGFPAFAVGVLCQFCTALYDQTNRRSLLAVSALSVLCMSGTMFLIRSDPFGIISWYMD